MRWTVAQVAEALGVAAPARLDALAGLAGVSIDSRTIQPGELFIAIHGPSHDGHDHVAAALAAGSTRPAWWRAADSGNTRKNSAENFLQWTTRSTPLHRLASRAWPSGGEEARQKNRRRGGFGGKDDHQRNPCGAGGPRGSAY